MFIIRLYRRDGVLLLTVQIQRNLTQAEMLEIKRITVGVTVECAIGYESDDDAAAAVVVVCSTLLLLFVSLQVETETQYPRYRVLYPQARDA